ncbi:unnamed protein product, partial [Prorocentrum cordatum]
MTAAEMASRVVSALAALLPALAAERAALEQTGVDVAAVEQSAVQFQSVLDNHFDPPALAWRPRSSAFLGNRAIQNKIYYQKRKRQEAEEALEEAANAKDVVYQVHDHAFNIYLVMDGIFGYVGEVEESRFDFGKGAFVTRQTTPKNITLTTHLATVGKSTSIPGKQLRVRPSTVMNPPDDRRAYSSREGHTSSMLEQNHGAWTPKPKSADTPGSSSGSGRHSRSLAEQPHQFGEPPWLQVDLGKVKKVKGIVMQGHPKEDQWVKKYKVQYSLLEDGPWVEVEDVLIGCADRNTECQA